MTGCLVLESFIGEMLAGKTDRVVFRVGDGALEENIRKVFDIEGVENFETGTFSADAVEVNAAAAEGGKVKFTVTPRGGDRLLHPVWREVV